MRIGKLRHRVAIDRRVDNRVNGSLVTDWEVHLCEAWAAIEPLSAREFLSAQAGQSEVSVRITLRYVPGLDATMRVRRLDDGRVYDIAGPPLEDARGGKSWITLMCRQGVNNG